MKKESQSIQTNIYHSCFVVCCCIFDVVLLYLWGVNSGCYIDYICKICDYIIYADILDFHIDRSVHISNNKDFIRRSREF